MWVEAWSFWPPGPEAPETPPCSFVEPMQRRRLSLFARRQLEAAHDCLQHAGIVTADIPSIFASRHGEVSQSLRLLEQIRAGDTPSPQGFALSVHNSVAGLWSLLRRDQSPSISIAAGSDTLFAALTEARLRLAASPASRLLLVIGDEPLPKDYQLWADGEELSYGLALLLNRDTGLPLPPSASWRDSSCPAAALAAALAHR
jgi:hypothetical protein